LLLGAAPIDTITTARIVGRVECSQGSLDDNESMQAIDIGIGVSSREAFTIGVTALPDPNNSSDYPPRGWLYVARRMVSQHAATGVGWSVHVGSFDFDLGAMRKIDKGVLFMVAKNTNIDGIATNVRMLGRVRVLCLT